MTPEEIGRELGVECVALCTIAATETGLDAVVELIDVSRESLVAREAFLGSQGDIVALEREVLYAIAGTRAGKPARCEAAILAARIARARGDAEAALALLGGADCVAARLEITRTILDGRLHDRIDQARQALASIPDSVAALQLAARLAARYDGDWDSAEQQLRDALVLDPASPSTHAMLGDLLVAIGRREEAAHHHRLTAQLMPRDAHAQIAASFADYFGPSPADAAVAFARIECAEGNEWLVRSLLAGGDVLAASHVAATPFSRQLVAAFAGEPFDATPFSGMQRALLYAVSGEAGLAIACLEAGAEQCDDEVMFTAVEPLFATLAGDVRFHALHIASHRIYTACDRTASLGV